MKEQLCQLLKESDSPTNSCENGSTIEYVNHFITNEDNILLFVSLVEHVTSESLYPSIKVPILIDKRGVWTFISGDNLIKEEIKSIQSDPYNGIWIVTRPEIEGLTPTVYFMENNYHMRRVVLPKSKEVNGYFQTVKNICFDIMKIVLKFESYGNYSAEAWESSYFDAVQPKPNWEKESIDYDYCMSNIHPHNWEVIQKKDTVLFKHSKTHQTIEVSRVEKNHESFSLQLGAFKNEKYVKRLQKSLKNLLYPSYIKREKVGNEYYFKLMIGSFTNLEKAIFVKKLLLEESKDVFIVKSNKN